jgi:tetratricopeptide (TPR) repeat protein
VLAAQAQFEGANTQLKYVETLIHRGRIKEAYGSLERLSQEDLPTHLQVDILCRLASFDFDRPENVEKGIAHFRVAIEVARRGGDEALVTSTVNDMAGRLTAIGRYDDATAVLQEALAWSTHNTTLWRRLGVVRWYADDPVQAYAHLTTALTLGHPRARILHARGQVLVELGNYAEAITELTEAVDNPRTALAQSYARSSRARAYALKGDFDLALKEFEVAERVCPDNGWLHHYRALSYDERGMTNEAVASYKRALDAEAPSLTVPKREHALRRPAELE